MTAKRKQKLEDRVAKILDNGVFLSLEDYIDLYGFVDLYLSNAKELCNDKGEHSEYVTDLARRALKKLYLYVMENYGNPRYEFVPSKYNPFPNYEPINPINPFPVTGPTQPYVTLSGETTDKIPQSTSYAAKLH